MPAAPTYPKAILKNLIGYCYPGKLSQRNKVVLHITEGTTASGAFATFYNSVAPNRVSAHFVIDRDGTVYQHLSIDDTAFHANSANTYSIGIEHVALTAKGAADLNKKYADKIAAGTQSPWHEMLATTAQYKSSAELVAWLCKLMKVPIDRSSVKTHYEVDQASHHVLCCAGALNPDRVVNLATALNDNP